jgi:hypothetical protein
MLTIISYVDIIGVNAGCGIPTDGKERREGDPCGFEAVTKL